MVAGGSGWQGDPAAGAFGQGRRGVFADGGLQGGVFLRGEFGDAADRHIDVQCHQLLDAGSLIAFQVKHLVKILNPFLVSTKKPGADEKLVTEMDFTLVDGVGLGGEAGIAGCFPVGVADVERLVQRVGGEVEHHDIVSEVHVAVGVDPLGPDDILVFDDRSAAHGAVQNVGEVRVGQAG